MTRVTTRRPTLLGLGQNAWGASRKDGRIKVGERPEEGCLVGSPPGTVCYRVSLLPELTAEGDLPVGVHSAGWTEFRFRFGSATPRRVWLLARLQALVSLAASTGKLLRVFVWGSFVTTKPSPRGPRRPSHHVRRL